MDINESGNLSTLPALQLRNNNQILTLTLTIYREHFIKILVFSLVINGIAALLLLPAQIEYQRGLLNIFREPTIGDQLALLAAQGVMSYFQTVPFAALCVYLTSEWLFNRNISMGEVIRESRAGMRRFAVGLLLYILLMLAFFVIFGFGSILFFPLAFLSGVALYAATTLYYFLAPIYTLENTKAVDGIVRAWQLGKVNFWSNFSLNLTLAIVTLGIALIVGSLFDSITTRQITLANWQSYFTFGIGLGTAVTVVFAPLLPIAMTIKYFDARLRYEGLDIALSAVEKEKPRLDDISSAVPAQKIVNNTDVRNMLIITGMLFAFGFLLVATTRVPF